MGGSNLDYFVKGILALLGCLLAGAVAVAVFVLLSIAVVHALS